MGAIGILPRLGSALIKIFNPTISHLQRSHSLWEQYQQPRLFNEIFSRDPKSDSWRIHMQDSEDRLIATDGRFVFEFEIQMEPEL